MKRRLSETPSCLESSQLNSPRCLDLALHWPVCCPDNSLSLEVHSRRRGDAVLVNMYQQIGCMCGLNLRCASGFNYFFLSVQTCQRSVTLSFSIFKQKCILLSHVYKLTIDVENKTKRNIKLVACGLAQPHFAQMPFYSVQNSLRHFSLGAAMDQL